MKRINKPKSSIFTNEDKVLDFIRNSTIKPSLLEISKRLKLPVNEVETIVHNYTSQFFTFDIDLEVE